MTISTGPGGSKEGNIGCYAAAVLQNGKVCYVILEKWLPF